MGFDELAIPSLSLLIIHKPSLARVPLDRFMSLFHSLRQWLTRAPVSSSQGRNQAGILGLFPLNYTQPNPPASFTAAAADAKVCSFFYVSSMVVVVPHTDEKMPIEVARPAEESPSLYAAQTTRPRS